MASLLTFPWLVAGVSAALQLLIVWALQRRRLVQRYVFFTAFLAWQAAGTLLAALVFANFSRQAYANIYRALESVDAVLLLLVILELYDHALGAYSGIRRFSRVLIGWLVAGLGLVVCLSVLFTGIVEPEPLQWRNNWFTLLFRSIGVVYCVLLMALVMFLAWFRLKIPALLTYFIFGWFVSQTIKVTLLFLRPHLGSQAYSALSLARSATLVVILAFWFFVVMKAADEDEERVHKPLFVLNHGSEELVMAQLEGLNASLARAFRR